MRNKAYQSPAQTQLSNLQRALADELKNLSQTRQKLDATHATIKEILKAVDVLKADIFPQLILNTVSIRCDQSPTEMVEMKIDKEDNSRYFQTDQGIICYDLNKDSAFWMFKLPVRRIG